MSLPQWFASLAIHWIVLCISLSTMLRRIPQLLNTCSNRARKVTVLECQAIYPWAQKRMIHSNKVSPMCPFAWYSGSTISEVDLVQEFSEVNQWVKHPDYSGAGVSTSGVSKRIPNWRKSMKRNPPTVCTGALTPPPVSPQAGQSFVKQQEYQTTSLLIVDACQWLWTLLSSWRR